MHIVKKILITLLLLFISLQFFRPQKNTADGLSDADITYAIQVPSTIHAILVEKCYDLKNVMIATATTPNIPGIQISNQWPGGWKITSAKEKRS